MTGSSKTGGFHSAFDVRHHAVAVGDVELAGVVEAAEHGGFHVAGRGKRQELVEAFRRDGEAHAFLRLGDEDLPRLEAGVFERGLREVHVAAAADVRQFADAGGEAARAVVGDETVQETFARLVDEVAHALLGDRVADLDRLHGAVLVQLFAGERGAVDAVLADAAAGHHDVVAGLD